MAAVEVSLVSSRPLLKMGLRVVEYLHGVVHDGVSRLVYIGIYGSVDAVEVSK